MHIKIISIIILFFTISNTTDAYELETKNSIKLLLNSPLIYNKPQVSTNSIAGRYLLNEIKKANKTIDFAIYGIRNQPEVMRALMEAKNRGVRIRGVVDKDINNENYYVSTKILIDSFKNIKSDYLTDILTKKKSRRKSSYKPYCGTPEGFKGLVQCVGYSLPNNRCIISSMASKEYMEYKGDIMHNKFFIFDDKVVWTGSTNISDSGTGGYNANNAILIYSEIIAETYKAEFEEMYLKNHYHWQKQHMKNSYLYEQLPDGSKIKVSFSPQGYAVEKLVRPIIQNAQSYIDVPVFYLTHKRLTGDLIKAYLRGVKVRIIIDATAAQNGYSKHEILRAVGIPVKIENWGGKMHMKSAVVDDKFLITGSMNWSSAGERKNDENILVIESSTYAKQMHSFFNELWTSIPDVWLTKDPLPESKDSSTSCNDGVDNDFDNLADANDPDCTNPSPKIYHIAPYKIVPKTDGYNLIKGNISKNGKKYFFLPTDKYYSKVRIDTERGEKWFCSVDEAREEGWIRPYK